MTAGASAETLTGGGGDNVFVFIDGLTKGGHDIITDFSATDSLLLSGYDESAATVLATAVVSGGATAITLSDHTQITFLNTDLRTLSNRVFSV